MQPVERRILGFGKAHCCPPCSMTLRPHALPSGCLMRSVACTVTLSVGAMEQANGLEVIWRGDGHELGEEKCEDCEIFSFNSRCASCSLGSGLFSPSYRVQTPIDPAPAPAPAPRAPYSQPYNPPFLISHRAITSDLIILGSNFRRLLS